MNKQCVNCPGAVDHSTDECPIRAGFETYMLGREHPVIGWIDAHWLGRGDDPATYANDYVQGCWVMWHTHRQTEQVPTPEFVWVRLMEALAGDNGCAFTASTDDYREVKPALVQLIAAGFFRDDADCLDGDIWIVASGEQGEAAARFASCAGAYTVMSGVLNRVFERPEDSPSLPAAGSAVEAVESPQYHREALPIDSDTRARFTRIAREAAISNCHRYSYMPTTPEEAVNWHSHSWVVDAMYLVQREALSALSAQQSAPERVSVPVLTDKEREDLLEFHEAVCCDAGHRVEKEGMQRLAEIGAVQYVGFGKHRMTEFGVALLASHAEGGKV